MTFGIKIEDGSEVVSSFSINENKKTLELYDWQIKAINYFFENNNEAIYVVATGSGKTVLAIEILKKILLKESNLRCLIVVPKNVIMETGWYKELYKNGFNLNEIGVYYGATKEYSKVTITNMQSLHKVALDLFDIVIYDEIHNYGTKRLLPYIEKKFKYRIGLSATLDRIDNNHWDILKSFNYNIFKYSPRQAIEDGVLNPFNFYNISVEMEKIHLEKYDDLTNKLNFIFRKYGGYNKIMMSKNPIKFQMLGLLNERKKLINNYPRKFDVVKKIVEKHPNQKILIFNQYNEQTSKLYWHLLDVGVKSRVIHSNISKKERDKNLIDFARTDGFNVLLTSKVLDEGYNLPSISVGVIMAGDSTPKQTIQRMGRVLRKKTDGTISSLYQIYCYNTIEEEYAVIRSKLFKELASYFNDYFYGLGQNFELED